MNNEMQLPDVFDKLHLMGFVVKVNDAHTKLFVSLQNRQVGTQEVLSELDYAISRNRIRKVSGLVEITE